MWLGKLHFWAFKPNTSFPNLKKLGKDAMFLNVCSVMCQDGRGVSSTPLGRIASFYYLSHQTMLHLHQNLTANLTLEELLHCLCHVFEYSQLPVRHNEDILNGLVASLC